MTPKLLPYLNSEKIDIDSVLSNSNFPSGVGQVWDYTDLIVQDRKTISDTNEIFDKLKELAHKHAGTLDYINHNDEPLIDIKRLNNHTKAGFIIYSENNTFSRSHPIYEMMCKCFPDYRLLKDSVGFLGANRKQIVVDNFTKSWWWCNNTGKYFHKFSVSEFIGKYAINQKFIRQVMEYETNYSGEMYCDMIINPIIKRCVSITSDEEVSIKIIKKRPTIKGD